MYAVLVLQSLSSQRRCCMNLFLFLLVAASLPAAAQTTPAPMLYPRLSKTLDSLAYVD